MPVPKGRLATAAIPKAIKPIAAKYNGFLGMGPLSLIIYGTPGIGKTSFAAHFPRCGFIRAPKEEGIDILLNFRRVPDPVFRWVPETFEQLLDQCDKVSTGKHGVETVVFDSLSEYELMAFHKHCREAYENNFTKDGFFAYGQGPKSCASTVWPDFITALDNVRAEGINIILTAHAQIKPRPNPLGSDYIAYFPKLEPMIWERTHTWCQACLFYSSVPSVKTDGLRKKADAADENRLIYTENSAVATAKNWFGLEPVLDAGNSGKTAFMAFEKAYRNCIPK